MVTDRKIYPQNQRASCQSNGGCSTMEIRPLVASLCQKSVTLDDDVFLKMMVHTGQTPLAHSYRYRPGQMTFQLLPTVKYVKF